MRERMLSGVVGAAAVSAGVIAVFVADNQAGTVALLLISVAFLLIAVQGTALTRFGSGEHAIELERRQWARDLVVQAGDQWDVRAAYALLTAASAIDPAVDGSPQAEPIRYEQRVGDALVDVIEASDTGATVMHPANRHTGADFLIRLAGGGLVAVQVKYSRSPMSRSALERSVLRAAEEGMPVLVVTNAPVSPAIKRRNDGAGHPANGPRAPYPETVTWNGPEDDVDLGRAFRNAARTAS